MVERLPEEQSVGGSIPSQGTIIMESDVNLLTVIPQRSNLPFRSEFEKLKDYFNKYHDYNFTRFDDNPTHTETIEVTNYTVIDKVDIKEKIVDYLGTVLAKCWIDPQLMIDLNNKPHMTLHRMGIILPNDMTLKIFKDNKSTRPRIVLFEHCDRSRKMKRVCFLELNMKAGR